MHYKGVRIIISVLAALSALMAIGGGIAMLTGLDQFPRISGRPSTVMSASPSHNYAIGLIPREKACDQADRQQRQNGG